MKLLFPSLLLAGASRVANAELDLYVREKFVTADGSECGDCTEGGSGGCFLKTRAFFLQNSCFNRGDDRSSVYDEMAGGVVCRQDFRESCEDEDITFDAEDVDEDCRDSWVLDECTDAEHMKKLSSWCTISSTGGPQGEYVVPLLTFQEFDSAGECGSSDYAHILLPDEGGSCNPLSFSNDGTYVTGSRQVSCDGSVFNAVRFDSTDCSGEALTTPFDGSSDVCPEESDASSIFTNDCAAPSIYCKGLSFSSEDSGSGNEGTNAPPPAPAGGPTENAGTSASSPGGLLMVGMALLSWIA